MDDLRATLQRTINTFLENNMLAVKGKDVSLFSVALSEECVRMYRPHSVVRRYPQFFKSELRNADYEAQMKIELLSMRDVSQNITRTVIDTAQRRATLWSEQTVITGDGETKNTIEVVFDLDFTEDGTKISRILEFIDTYESTRVIEEMLSKAAAE
ncbi:hypothetical protein SAMD00023353_0100750 [Rosellinia necatrix]|uniref:Uncharacterized protein n=1 Tax=Rosellinia necatrix TaxID=77044 RepID=A0A1S7UHB2_ROSNE|nr:hypothetical protein SAMD00023353_0100750 [Rosellinia necatrix]